MNDLRQSLLFFYTETPLHAGSGAGIGAIDLPIQRERMSKLPQVQGSGVKGALRELFRAPDGDDSGRGLEEALFGPRPPDPSSESTDKDKKKDQPSDPAAHEHAGAVAVTDARILLMPVRTAHGGWAWVTSPLVLQRLARDLSGLNPKEPAPGWASLRPESNEALVTAEGVDIAPSGQLVIEDALYDAKVDTSGELKKLVQVLQQALPKANVYDPVRARLSQQLAILSDEELCYWASHGTEIVTRVRIDPDTGTVERGALWTEESLPSESLLWSLVMVSGSRQKHKKKGHTTSVELDAILGQRLNDSSRMFLGGDRTVGRGLVALGRKGAE